MPAEEGHLVCLCCGTCFCTYKWAWCVQDCNLRLYTMLCQHVRGLFLFWSTRMCYRHSCAQKMTLLEWDLLGRITNRPDQVQTFYSSDFSIRARQWQKQAFLLDVLYLDSVQRMTQQPVCGCWLQRFCSILDLFQNALSPFVNYTQKLEKIRSRLKNSQATIKALIQSQIQSEDRHLLSCPCNQEVWDSCDCECGNSLVDSPCQFQFSINPDCSFWICHKHWIIR